MSFFHRSLLTAVLIAATVIIMIPHRTAAIATNLSSGDLASTSASGSIYYIDANRHRHIFPRRSVFESWFAADAEVKKVSRRILRSHSLEQAIQYRPGTVLVQLRDDPAIYGIEPNGLARKFQSIDLISRLYGQSWRDRLVLVKKSKKSFFSTYNLGVDITRMEYPTGTLLRMSPDWTTVYLIWNGQRRKILSNEVFSANHFQWGDVVYAPQDFSSLPEGTPVTGQEAALIDVTQTTKQAVKQGVPAPVLAGPSSPVYSGNSFAITWAKVPNAIRYSIEMDTNSAFNTASKKQYTVTSGDQTYYNFQQTVNLSTTYYFRVYAVTGDSTSTWSNIISVQVVNESISLSASAGSIEINSLVQLSWSSFTSAKIYMLEVSTDSNFSNAATFTINAPPTTYNYTPTTNAGRYHYFRVKATLESGSQTAWSNVVGVYVSQ